MIPDEIIATLDGIASVALAASVPILLIHLSRRLGTGRYLLLSIVIGSLILAFSNFLEWTSLAPNTEFLEDIVMPLMPTLWLFAFLVELQQADRNRLAASEARYRALVENATVAIISIDSQRTITLWNRGAERLFGYAASEVLGRNISLVYPEDVRQQTEEEVRPGLQREGKWFGEQMLLRKDGTQFIASISLGRIFGPHGETLATLGVLMDATEHIQLRDQLIQAQKMETVGTLAGGLAHDFSNLLTAVHGFGSLLKLSLPAGTENYDAAVSIERAALRGTQLVRQLMNFSHRHPTKSEPVDLNMLVRETCEFIDRTFPRTIEVSSELDPNLGAIRGDPSQMHQVIMNLCVNARDAMPQGGHLVLATHNMELIADDPRGVGVRPGPCVCLTVSDTGQGIPPDVLPRIFEPFFTTKPADLGTGLGLATVYAIVKRHGGAVTVKSDVGRGTDFCVVFPTLDETTVSAPSDPAPRNK
jgi:two-component system, cell cycle sensor histidine kinase and response regulator CckA